MGWFDKVSGALANVSPGAAMAVARFNDRQTAEAVVAIMVGTSWADGQREPEEDAKIRMAFAKHPILSKFDQTALMRKFVELNDGFALDVEDGLANCLKELRDIAGKDVEKSKAVMRMGKAAAMADGEAEPAERGFLARCAKELFLDPAEFGL